MNRVFFGDNLKILKNIESESIDLIYIDPPFNTGKIQKLTSLKTLKTKDGDRKGFSGNNYKSIELGTKSYNDSLDGEVNLTGKEKQAFQYLLPDINIYYIEGFLKPRLLEAHRILKSEGSLYFHIDYREVHYCKILLDRIFGRDSFINEIIWAYDFGGKSRSRWPAKHDNILFYAKDPDKFIWNTNEIDRIPYMAPGLVGPEKAKKGKLPTDTWWYEYVGGKKNTDTWWHSIVGTNSKERLGYPTQKPLGIINRIIRTSSYPGSTVLDFFAGSGTVGQSCLDLDRNFILIDNNIESMEVMAKRFFEYSNIEWINFDPSKLEKNVRKSIGNIEKSSENDTTKKQNLSEKFLKLATDSTIIRSKLQHQNEQWKNSPFEWVLQLPARTKSKLGKHLIISWLKDSKFQIEEDTDDQSVGIIVNGKKVSLKFSTLWKSGIYRFQQIRKGGYDYLLCFGLSPDDAHCYIFSIDYVLSNAKEQHRGAEGAEYWITINPHSPPNWARNHGGPINNADNIVRKILKNK